MDFGGLRLVLIIRTIANKTIGVMKKAPKAIRCFFRKDSCDLSTRKSGLTNNAIAPTNQPAKTNIETNEAIPHPFRPF
jgi:hypothetical protein